MKGRKKLFSKHNYSFVLVKTRPFYYIVCYEWGKNRRGKIGRIKLKKADYHKIDEFKEYISTVEGDIILSVANFCRNNNIPFQKYI